MKRTQYYNNISEKLLKTAQLKKGETAVFKMVNMRQKPWAPGQWFIPTINVPSTDDIYDPGDDTFKQIAYIKKVNPDGTFELDEIYVGPYGRQPGALVLSGDNAKDRELYTYLYLSNFWDRADRDESKDLLLRLERPTEEAKKKREKRGTMIEAAVLAQNMKAEDLRTFAQAMGKDPDLDLAILRDFAEDMAINDPENFMKIANSSRTKIKSLVRRSTNKKAIHWDAATSTWRWSANNEIILSVPRGKDRWDFFVGFLIENENGPSVLKALEDI